RANPRAGAREVRLLETRHGEERGVHSLVWCDAKITDARGPRRGRGRVEGRRRAPIGSAADQLPPSALRMSSPCDFHHWCRTVMSVPTEKCRTPMSRKYFAWSAEAISARGGTPILMAVSNTRRSTTRSSGV